MTDKEGIRRSRRAKRIAGAYDLLESGDWVYCIKRGSTDHHWHRPNARVDAPNSTTVDARLEKPHVMVIEYTGTDSCVRVPSAIDGLPVLELHNKVFYDKRSITSVTMPDSIIDIGLKVFGRCRNLEEVRFSDSISRIDSATFTGSSALKRVHLPAQLETLDYKLLSGMRLESLEIPAGTTRLEWQTMNYEIVSGISVNSANASFSSDGYAIYSKDGSTLVKALVAVDAYTPLESCVRIGPNAFKGMRDLEALSMNAALAYIDSYAFFNTGLEELALPESLREIDDFAFSMCDALTRVRFNEGLERIGKSAFAKTAIPHVDLPASLRELEPDAFLQTRIEFGEDSGFRIDEHNPYYFTDGFALYARETANCAGGDPSAPRASHAPLGMTDDPTGMHLVKYLANAPEYRVYPACTKIDDDAFAGCGSIESVFIPDSVRILGDQAFKNCNKLAHIDLGNSIEEIGESAFSSTALRDFSFGPKLRSIGNCALCVGYAKGGRFTHALSSISVDAQNSRFYREGPLFIERTQHGDRAIVCTGSPSHVVIPKQVSAISDFCFAGTGVCTLELHDGIKSIAKHAFYSLAGLEDVRIDYAQPVEGFSSARIVFPGGDASAEGAARSLGFDDDGVLFRFASYDAWVIHYWLLYKRNSSQVARMIFARLENPVMLSAKTRSEFETAIKTILSNLCSEYIRRRDLASFEKLIAHGFIDAENIDKILHTSEKQGAAETTAYLLDAKRRRFGTSRHDFSL